jgi:hypothetical protein
MALSQACKEEHQNLLSKARVTNTDFKVLTILYLYVQVCKQIIIVSCAALTS